MSYIIFRLLYLNDTYSPLLTIQENHYKLEPKESEGENGTDTRKLQKPVAVSKPGQRHEP